MRFNQARVNGGSNYDSLWPDLREIAGSFPPPLKKSYRRGGGWIMPASWGLSLRRREPSIHSAQGPPHFFLVGGGRGPSDTTWFGGGLRGRFTLGLIPMRDRVAPVRGNVRLRGASPQGGRWVLIAPPVGM